MTKGPVHKITDKRYRGGRDLLSKIQTLSSKGHNNIYSMYRLYEIYEAPFTKDRNAIL